MPKLTPWFPPSVKPVRVGKYSRKFPGRNYRDYWDGEEWLTHMGGIPLADQGRPWRGLAEDPNPQPVVTEEMIRAGCYTYKDTTGVNVRTIVQEIYLAMRKLERL